MNNGNRYFLKQALELGPLILLLCVMPFITYVHTYTYEDPDQGFYLCDRVFTDFYSHAKGFLFYGLCIWMIFVLVVKLVRKEMRINGLIEWILILAGYAGLVLSTWHSISMEQSILGGYQRFEGVMIRGGYIIVAVYACKILSNRKKRRILTRFVYVAAFLECMIGLCQMCGNDPITWNIIKKMIVPDGGKNVMLSTITDRRVYLTLANPNYACIYLAIMIILISAGIKVVYIEKRTHYHLQLAGLIAMDILCLVEMTATNSRIGFLMLTTAGIVISIIKIGYKKRHRYGQILESGQTDQFMQKNHKSIGLMICISVGVVLIGADAVNDFSMAHKFADTLRSFSQTRVNAHVKSISANEKGVYIAVDKAVSVDPVRGVDHMVGSGDSIEEDDISICVTFRDFISQERLKLYVKTPAKEGGQRNEAKKYIKEDISKMIDRSTGDVDYPGLENVNIAAVEVDHEPMIQLTVDDATFFLAYDDMGYQMYWDNGYYDSIEKVEAVDCNGWEHLASGRVYIWSRSLPLIKKYALTGSGCDTFYLIYPQNDYAGKARYCRSPYTIVEKPHNTYLLLLLENGWLTLTAFLGVILLAFVRCIRHGVMHVELVTPVALLTAFLIAFFFNDSSIVISPFFWVIIGIMVAHRAD